MYFSGDPEMGSFSSYTGRLAQRDGCVVIVLGEEMLRGSKIAEQDDNVAIPLFQPGYRVEGQEQEYSIIADDGRRIPFGSIVTGEGGRIQLNLLILALLRFVPKHPILAVAQALLTKSTQCTSKT